MQQTILIFIAVTNLLIGTYVLVYNPRAIINRSFFVFVIGTTLWILGFILLFTFKNFLFDKLIHYGVLIMALGLFMFTRMFPVGKILGRRFWLLCLPLFAVAIFVAPFNLLIKDMIVHSDGTLEPVNGPLFPFYITLIGIYVIWSLIVLAQHFYKSSGTARMKIKYFFSGIVIFTVMTLIFDGLLPSVGIYNFNLLGPLSSIVFIAFTAYAIIKHQLLDIRIVIQRGLIYFALLGIIAVIYISGLQTLGYFLNKVTYFGIILSAGTTMVIGILFFRPLEKYFQKITDKIFFKDKYNYPESLHRLSRILNTNLNQADIIGASSQALKEILKASEVIFCLSDAPGQAESRTKGERYISVPILFEDKSIGAIKLGPKLSGDSYDSQDVQLMETFAHQAAVAIEKGRLYEKVEEYNTHLERLVEDRTKEIKNLQEEQKRTMIDISHNLQTPLTVIKGELDFLSDMPACRDKVSTVKKSIDRISGFIRQFLYLAKLDHSKDLNDFKLINLSALVRESAEYFEVMASEAGARFRCTIADKIFIIGNKRLLEEILTNLVSNAIKYRKTNFESVIIVSLEEKGSNVELLVVDNGIGIAPKDLPLIFTRFYRSVNVLETSQGIGLGLAIVKKIVEKHKGNISVSSVLGDGSEFCITFQKASHSLLR